MMRKIFGAVGLVLLLSACTSTMRNVPPSAVYDFGPPAPGINGGWPGIALDVRSPPWFESLGIDYRLAYDDPLRPREYVESRWAASPGYLLGRRLQQSLMFSPATGGSVAQCLLRVDLQEFAQVFDSRSASRGVLNADLVLIGAQRQQLAARRIAVEKPALTPDARGGVGALVAVSNDFGAEISRWLAELQEKTNLASCRRLPVENSAVPSK